MSDKKTNSSSDKTKKPVSRPVNRVQKEREWADRDPDENRERPVRLTYRDGSEINECWNPGKY